MQGMGSAQALKGKLIWQGLNLLGTEQCMSPGPRGESRMVAVRRYGGGTECEGFTFLGEGTVLTGKREPLQAVSKDGL